MYYPPGKAASAISTNVFSTRPVYPLVHELRQSVPKLETYLQVDAFFLHNAYLQVQKQRSIRRRAHVFLMNKGKCVPRAQWHVRCLRFHGRALSPEPVREERNEELRGNEIIDLPHQVQHIF